MCEVKLLAMLQTQIRPRDQHTHTFHHGEHIKSNTLTLSFNCYLNSEGHN